MELHGKHRNKGIKVANKGDAAFVVGHLCFCLPSFSKRWMASNKIKSATAFWSKRRLRDSYRGNGVAVSAVGVTGDLR
ncbi:MAG: hypothetical protein HY741_14290 [Chloroflexi bacterium]|nr:hypothetical protein [Chloroflexota bacterium]